MLNIYTFAPKKYFGANTYLIESAGEFAVIDPSVEYSEVLANHPEIKEKLKAILLTHAHFDHILKISSWCNACKNVYIGKDEAKALSDPYLNCYLGFFGTNDGYFGEYIPVSEKTKIKLGSDTISVIETPGHTVGGVCYKCGESIFVGDTLFADGGYGRCDLPGGDMDTLEKSLVKLFSLKDDAVIYPGHGICTTLSDAIKYFM